MRASAAMRRIHLSDLIMASWAGGRRERSPLSWLSPLPFLRILDDDIRKLPREILGFLRHEDGRPARDLLVDRGDLAVGIAADRRPSGVRLLPNVGIERQPAEKPHRARHAHSPPAAP